MVNEAIIAVEKLKEKNINATLVDLHTIRPLDTELINKVAKKCKKMIVCENHRYAGGVGEMISSVIVQNNPIPMSFVNVGDEYGEVGNIEFLAKKFKLTADNIVEQSLKLIQRVND
jgi:transketolase